MYIFHTNYNDEHDRNNEKENDGEEIFYICNLYCILLYIQY